MRELPFASLFAACAALLPAQNPCEGNGIGSAYVTTTPAIAGGQWVMNAGSSATPNGFALLVFGNGAGQVFPFCHDISALFVGMVAVLDGTGNAQFTFGPIPPGAFGTTLYARTVAFEPSNLSFSKVVRIEVEFANSTRQVAPMASARSLHTCTALGSGPQDNRTGAIVAGGATGSMIFPLAMATTEVFDALSRTWSPGPTMSMPRASHAAVRLLDGRILIAGGMVNAAPPSVGGPATASCEIYSPASNTLAPTGSMLQARMGHAMTVLPDGRVLASGGFANWTDSNSGPGFVANLNTAQETTEIFDPVAGTWSAGPTMASKRSGHTQTVLGDGRVVIVAGVNGGVQLMAVNTWIYVPTFTSVIQSFDPTTNTLSPMPLMPIARGFHGATLLGNGKLLVTGGASNVGPWGSAAATSQCSLFDPVTNTWTGSGSLFPTAPVLPNSVAFHTQTVTPSGNALVIGGYLGDFAYLIASDAITSHDGVTATVLAPLGAHPFLPATPFAPGAHAAVVLHDGTTLVTGGYANFPGATLASAVLHIAP